MRKFVLPLTLSSLVVVLAAGDLQACGDKYIRLATRLGAAYIAENPATVLIYMPADSVVPAAASRLGLQDSLKRAGHAVYAIRSEADLETALNARRYDIVIADAASTAMISPLLRRVPGGPSLVPVFHKQSKRQLATTRQQVRCLITTSEASYLAVAEVDHVMHLRTTATIVP